MILCTGLSTAHSISAPTRNRCTGLLGLISDQTGLSAGCCFHHILSFTDRIFCGLDGGRVCGRGCLMISRLFCPPTPPHFFQQSARGAGRRHVTLQSGKAPRPSCGGGGQSPVMIARTKSCQEAWLGPWVCHRRHHHRRISHRRRKLLQLWTLPPSIKFRVKKPCAEIRSIRLVVGDGWSVVLGRAGTTTDQPDQGRTRRGWGEKMVGGKDCGRRAEEEEAATEERGGGAFSGPSASSRAECFKMLVLTKPRQWQKLRNISRNGFLPDFAKIWPRPH